MRIALGQINPVVGDLDGNRLKIVQFAQEARRQEAAVIVFPELAIVGYPPKDLLLKTDFIERNLRALNDIAVQTKGIDVIVGYAQPNTSPVGRPLHNAVALCRDGKVVSRHLKTLLPTYDVFDESRYFEPGENATSNNIIQVCSSPKSEADCIPSGISICEDLWNDERLIPRRLYHQNPILDLHQAGARLLINASASPFVVNKHGFRRELFSSQVRQIGVPLAYVNQVGGNDQLVFDGNSCVFDAEGYVIGQAKDFEEDLLVIDLEPAPKSHSVTAQPLARSSEHRTEVDPERGLSLEQAVVAQPDEVKERQAGSNRIESFRSGIASVHAALVLGLQDYVTKCGFSHVVIGLSGGIDSAVTAALAVDAFGPEKVTGVAMPSRYSSEHSVTDARTLAKNLGVTFHLVPIEPVHKAFESTLNELLDGVRGLTQENLQARIRGATLMAFSNKTGALLLTTGNKSEIAVGYCTLYGDMAGGLAVISDLPKTDVYKLATYLNEIAGRERIPANTITKPPSAELAPDQRDTDSLPPYEILDAILFRYVELDESIAQITAAGYDSETVKRIVKLTDRSEYKRRQAAPGIKVTSRAFGIGRRMPIAQRYNPLTSAHGEPSPNHS